MNRSFANGSALTLPLSPRRGNSHGSASNLRNGRLPNPAPKGPRSPGGEGRGEGGPRPAQVHGRDAGAEQVGAPHEPLKVESGQTRFAAITWSRNF